MGRYFNSNMIEKMHLVFHTVNFHQGDEVDLDSLAKLLAKYIRDW